MLSTTTEPNSARNPKTPAKPGKSVGKTRENSAEKEKLFKTKTMANLKNFSNTAKNLNKTTVKTPTNNNGHKTSIFQNTDSSTMDTASKNKTFAVEKSEPTMKKEKTKPNLLTKDLKEESKNSI